MSLDMGVCVRVSIRESVSESVSMSDSIRISKVWGHTLK